MIPTSITRCVDGRVKDHRICPVGGKEGSDLGGVDVEEGVDEFDEELSTGEVTGSFLGEEEGGE